MQAYFRPLLSADTAIPAGAIRIAGGWTWAMHAERITRDGDSRVVGVDEIPDEVRAQLANPRPPFAGLEMGAPRLMGILNVTPDSFSDGGLAGDPDGAIRAGADLFDAGADIVDIGGESTRPGADTVPETEELRRIHPVVAALAGAGGPLSIDTRKAAVASAAADKGARIVNDVSALGFDPAMAPLVAERRLHVVLMHARGDPKTMQDAPAYENVLLDVYDALAAAVAQAEAAGIPRARIAVDPGIGFGKTQAHNLALLARLSLFHGLGCAVLLGASRKRFIGTLSGATVPSERMPGSVGVALAAVGQGVQILRVHDILATRQALTLWRAARGQ